MAHTYGLGRVPSVQHPRMAEFPVEALLTPDLYPRSYTWDCDVWLDQGQTSMCVGYGWAHEGAARPAVRKVDEGLARRLYTYAQQHDYWPGEDYEGSSVDGGAQAARHAGLIDSWWWARNLETALTAIGHKGPAVIGVDWWTQMFTPDAAGWLHPAGAKEGGHCTLVTSVRLVFKPGTTTEQRRSSGWSAYLNHDKSYVGIHNSWGLDWQPAASPNRLARLRIPDFSMLLTDGGECCIPQGRIKEPKG